MDSYTINMLKILNFEILIDSFKNQNIDKEVLENLNENDLKELVPNLGQRKKIALYINKVRENSQSQQELPELAPENIDSEVNTLNNIDSNHSMIVEILDASNDDNILNSTNQPVEKTFHISTPENFEQPPAKRQKLLPFFCNDYTLEEFLQRSTIGTGILKYYSDNNFLKESVRGDLVRLMIDGVMGCHATITSLMAEVLAETIIELFPTESKAAYYYKAISNKKNSGGKLLDRYRNIKRKYALTPRPKVGPMHTDTIIPDSEMLYKINWLQSSSEPWQLVEQYWSETREERLKDRGCPGLASEYLIKWSSLVNNLGYTLVEQDFQYLYPDNSFGFLGNWISLTEQVNSVLRSHYNIVLNREEYHSDNDWTVAILKQITNILPCVGKRSGKKPLWKPSSRECEDAFVVTVSNVAEISEEEIKRKNKYSEHGLGYQPHIYRVQELNLPEKYFIKFDNIVYKFSDINKTLDVCFKLFQSLNLSYPYETTNTWTFIQRYLYGIETIYDVKTPCISSLLKSLKKGLN